ncbi:MAG: hypothetical protein EBV03_02870 [Proteobacteria bacterium]|nr:hypothetical protein [Pseudomonadota bacterium]
MPKTVLFVVYGGGHARMVVPVIRALSPDIHCISLALTMAGPIFTHEKLPYLGYKDFVRPGDEQALAWGKELAQQFHAEASGIELAESEAYLGLCYADLVARHGEAEAARMLKEQGRHAFLPLTVLERVLDTVKPDMVVTTNSPRSERAAVAVAKARGITTLSMVDLFGIMHFHPLESDYITVLTEQVMDNLALEGVHKPRSAYLVTGNPAFDVAFDYRGPVDYAWRKEHFPAIPDAAKTLLWIDMPAYWELEPQHFHVRNDEEILRDLEDMAEACRANDACLLVRPHPSQPREIYHEWMQRTNYPHVFFAASVPLYPLLRATHAVATYTSTVSVEALLMQRPVIQLRYHPGRSDMPLGEWGLALTARSRAELPARLREALTEDEAAKGRMTRVAQLLPQEKAGPKVARCIEAILAGRVPN